MSATITTTNSFFANLHKLRKNGDLCDVTLVSYDSNLSIRGSDDAVSIRAHKAVLAAQSPFFRAKLLEKVDVLELPNMDGETLVALVDYLYTSKMEEEEWVVVCKLLTATDYLTLPDLAAKCLTFLVSSLTVNNVLGLWKLLSTLKFEDYYHHQQQQISAFIDTSFSKVLKGPEFIELDAVEKVTELLSRDTIVVSTEEEIFEGVLNWVNHRKEEREDNMDILLKHVRMYYLSERYLKEKVKPYLKDETLMPALPSPPRHYHCGQKLVNTIHEQMYSYLGQNLVEGRPLLLPIFFPITDPDIDIFPAKAFPATALFDFVYPINEREKPKPTFSLRAVYQINVISTKHEYWWGGVGSGVRGGNGGIATFIVFPKFIIKKEEPGGSGWRDPGYMHKSSELPIAGKFCQICTNAAPGIVKCNAATKLI